MPLLVLLDRHFGDGLAAVKFTLLHVFQIQACHLQFRLSTIALQRTSMNMIGTGHL
jgi:hypothetical protein